MMSPRSGYNKTMRVMVLHVTKAEEESAARFQGLPGRARRKAAL